MASASKSSSRQQAVAESETRPVDGVVRGVHGFVRFEEASALKGSTGVAVGKAAFGPELVPVQEQAAQGGLGPGVSKCLVEV